MKLCRKDTNWAHFQDYIHAKYQLKIGEAVHYINQPTSKNCMYIYIRKKIHSKKPKHFTTRSISSLRKVKSKAQVENSRNSLDKTQLTRLAHKLQRP